MYNPRIMLFTIFIPTYNRAHTLPRAFASIEAQTCRDFDVVIVDDGSTDNTPELVKEWTQRVGFPVRYVRQQNQGKHGAFNAALEHLDGELMVMLDSDDKLTKDALDIFRRHWLAIPESERDGFCGVEGLTAFFDGTVAGSRFPEDVLDSDYLEIRRRYQVSGDKKNAIRSDLLKRFPYPVFPGERHVRPSLLWKRLADNYRTRYVNEVVEYIEYQPGGLSSNRFCLRMRNPMGYRYYYMEEVQNPQRAQSFGEQVTNYGNYIRYSLHSGVGIGRQLADVPSPWLWLLGLPRGVIKYISDRLRAGRCR